MTAVPVPRPRGHTGSTVWRTCWDGCCRYRWTTGYLTVMVTLIFLALIFDWKV